MKKSLVLGTRLCAGVGALALLVSGCGASGGGGSAGGSGKAQNQSAQFGGQGGRFGQGGPGGFRVPGANGTIAAVSGRTAQVQGMNVQTAVTWNAKTIFSAEQTVSASAVHVGVCVVAMPSRASFGNGGPKPSATSTTDTTATTTGPTTVAAATVRITGSGTCTVGFRTRRGTPPGGAPQGAPSGVPSGVPSGFPSGTAGRFGGRGIGGFGAVGKVSKVTANGFVVTSSFGGTSRTVTVTTTSATTYTENVHATAAAVKVGRCMSAQGSTDSTGAVTAARVTVSAPVGGTCTGGFGVFGGRGASAQ